MQKCAVKIKRNSKSNINSNDNGSGNVNKMAPAKEFLFIAIEKKKKKRNTYSKLIRSLNHTEKAMYIMLLSEHLVRYGFVQLVVVETSVYTSSTREKDREWNT